MKYITVVIGLFKNHKAKWLVLFFSSLVFFLFLFPNKDLSDFISSKVSQLTKNAVYINFDELKLSATPPGLELTQISVDTEMFPTVSAESISVTPSISAILKQIPGGSVNAKGLFRGNVEISLQPGTNSESGTPRQKFVISAQTLSLEEIRNFSQLPVRLKGKLDVESKGQVDLTFTDQPDAEVLIKVQNFELPSNSINTQMGPLSLPELKLGQLQVKGRLSNGKLSIEEGIIGQQGDELTGTIKGYVNLTIQNQKGQISPIFGAYSLDIDLNFKKNLHERASLFLSFIDQYKFETENGTRYAFKLSATSFQNPPNMGALR
jgi:type II secretion system protein N